jgi:type I restriction enzyme S subunit
MDNLAKKSELKPLGDYITQTDRRNRDLKYNLDNLRGVNKGKQFMETVAATGNLDLSKYKIIDNNDFVYSGMQTGRDKCIRIALNNDSPIIVSPAYSVFKIIDKNKLLPEFLYSFLKRPESDRLGWYKSDSSVRSNLDWDRFMEFQIPVPSMEVQKSIVAIHHALESRKKLNDKLRDMLKQLSPVLIKRAKDLVEEA